MRECFSINKYEREGSRRKQTEKLSYDIISIQLTLQWFLKIGQCFRIIWSWDERYGCLYSETEKSFDMNSEGLVTFSEAILWSGGSASRSLGAMGFFLDNDLRRWWNSVQHTYKRWNDDGFLKVLLWSLNVINLCQGICHELSKIIFKIFFLKIWRVLKPIVL